MQFLKSHLYQLFNANFPLHCRGGDLGGTGGIVPLKKLGGGDGSAFIPPPQYLENVFQIYNVKTIKNEKEDETHVTRDRHTSIFLFHCLYRLT